MPVLKDFFKRVFGAAWAHNCYKIILKNQYRSVFYSQVRWEFSTQKWDMLKMRIFH